MGSAVLGSALPGPDVYPGCAEGTRAGGACALGEGEVYIRVQKGHICGHACVCSGRAVSRGSGDVAAGICP